MRYFDGWVVFLLLSIRTWKVSLVSVITESQVYVLDGGDSLVLECFFEADLYNMFDYPLLWRKVQRTEETQVNIMGNVNQPFLATGRYDVDFVVSAPIYKLRLYITGVTQEDSGNYTCEVRGPHSVIRGQVTHFVLVRASIESVVIADDRNGTGSSSNISRPEINVIENIRSVIRCNVRGGYPPPKIEIFLNERDLTRDFDVLSWTNITGTRGLRLMTQRLEAVASAFVVQATDHMSTLRCVASVPGLKRIVSHVRINVSFAPKITCFSTRASLWEQNINLRCEIRSNPRVIALFWIIDSNGTTLAEGEVIDERWILVADRTDRVVETQLFLHRIEPSSFRRYTLVAENSVAIATAEAELVRSVLSRAIDPNNMNMSNRGRGTGGGGGGGGGGGRGRGDEEEDGEREGGGAGEGGRWMHSEKVRAYVRSSTDSSFIRWHSSSSCALVVTWSVVCWSIT